MLQEVIKPLSMRIEPGACDLVSINVDSHNLPATIAAIERTWNSTLPDKPFSYFFLDEYFDKQYRAEDRFGRLFMYFAVLAIFISCPGLMRLAAGVCLPDRYLLADIYCGRVDGQSYCFDNH